MTQNTTRTLNIFIINAKHLTQRLEKVLKIIQFIGMTAKEAGFGPIRCNTMRVLDKEDIISNIQKYNDRVLYDKTGDEVYDSMLENLSVEVISNIEKHYHSWKCISEDQDSDSLNLIIEDDTIIMNDHIPHVKSLFEYLQSNDSNRVNANEWDILFLGIAPPTTDPFSLKRFTEKVLPCKEAYFVNKNTASRLIKTWSENKLTHSLRLQLSKYFNNNPDIKVMYPNQRVTVDGSKLGLYPTTINRRNILLFNADYIKLFQIFNSPVENIKEKYQEARALYKQIQTNSGTNVISPDITHIFGLIEYKLGNYDRAEELFSTAIIETVKQQGHLTNNCELLTNAIINYSNVQKDVNAIFTNPSKYETVGIVPLLD